MPITGLYAGLLALVALFLWSRISATRLQTGISIGDGGNLALADRIRRHANFAEHVPLALVLLGTLELGGTRAVILHALGGTLLAARIAHPLGLRHDKIPHPLRALGAGATFLVTLASALLLLSRWR
jgi:hypothetical protein